MAEYFKGTVYQAKINTAALSWGIPELNNGNDLRYSVISEVDCTLDTSRFHISIPIKGEETYIVDGQRYCNKQNEYFIFNPNQHVRAEGRFPDSVNGYCIFLTEKTLEEVAKGQQLTERQLLDSPFDFPWQQQEFIIKNYTLQENTFGRYLKKIQSKLTNNSNFSLLMDWDTFYFGLAEQLILGHLQIGNHLNAIPFTHNSTKQEVYKRISRVHGFIIENFVHPITLDDLSMVAFLSKYYIIRLYRKIYGLTPYQHIIELRILTAKKLLKKNFSPSEVATKLSFYDRRAFSKVFKKIVGISPSKYQEL